MASTPSATNITKPPRLVNGVANSIFNASDFETTTDQTYIKKSGDLMTGSLTVPTLVCNGGITLQSVYSSFPTQTQLGGVFKVTTSVTSTNNATSNYASLSLPAGCYIILFNFLFTNNISPANGGAGALVTLSNVQCGISTAMNLPTDKTIMMYAQSLNYSNGSTTVNGTSFYQHINATNRTLNLNSFVGATNILTVTATFTAVRIA